MAPKKRPEDDEDNDEDEPEEKAPQFDYEELDEKKWFKKIEHKIFSDFQQAKNSHLAEDDKEGFDVETWMQNYVENNKYDMNRIKYVVTLGVYGGERDPEGGARHGNGEALYPNGDHYVGGYNDGKKHGAGLYIYKSLGSNPLDKRIDEIAKTNETIKKKLISDRAEAVTDMMKLLAPAKVTEKYIEYVLEYGPYPFYKGSFVEDAKDGDGTMKYLDGSVYIGTWRSSKRNGNGTLFFANGDVYQGMFQDGLKHGTGLYKFARVGAEYDGQWEKGQMLKGTWRMTSDGILYCGTFEDNLPEGDGEMWFPDQTQSGKEIAVSGKFTNKFWNPTLDFAQQQ